MAQTLVRRNNAPTRQKGGRTKTLKLPENQSNCLSLHDVNDDNASQPCNEVSAHNSSLSLSIYSLVRSISIGLGLHSAATVVTDNQLSSQDLPQNLDENDISGVLLTMKELEEQHKEYLKIKEQYGKLPAAESLHAESESSVTSSVQLSSGSVSNFEVNCETQEQDCNITKGWKLSDTAKSIYKNIKTLARQTETFTDAMSEAQNDIHKEGCGTREEATIEKQSASAPLLRKGTTK